MEPGIHTGFRNQVLGVRLPFPSSTTFMKGMVMPTKEVPGGFHIPDIQVPVLTNMDHQFYYRHRYSMPSKTPNGSVLRHMHREQTAEWFEWKPNWVFESIMTVAFPMRGNRNVVGFWLKDPSGRMYPMNMDEFMMMMETTALVRGMTVPHGKWTFVRQGGPYFSLRHYVDLVVTHMSYTTHDGQSFGAKL